MSNRSAFFWVIIGILVVLLILLAGGCGLMYYRYKKVEEATLNEVGNEISTFYNERREAEQENVKAEEGEKVIMDGEDWTIYQNERYGYSFGYPSDWQVGSTEDDHVILLIMTIKPLLNFAVMQ